MGIETQAVLAGHHDIAALCGRLRDVYGATDIRPRGTHKPDYQMIEFIDLDGAFRIINVFLNSYAREDYKELDAPQSTLVTMELGPTSQAVIGALAHGAAAWFRRQDTGPWTPIIHRASEGCAGNQQ